MSCVANWDQADLLKCIRDVVVCALKREIGRAKREHEIALEEKDKGKFY